MVVKFGRSIPYLKILSTTPPHKRKAVLSAFPNYVIDDITELIYNIIKGKTNIPKNNKNILFKHKAKLLKLVNARSKAERRKIIQTGGFLPIAPILGKVALGLAPVAIQKFFSWLFGGSSKNKE